MEGRLKNVIIGFQPSHKLEVTQFQKHVRVANVIKHL